jgi:Flp pilus assembly CpaF family ATPase
MKNTAWPVVVDMELIQQREEVLIEKVQQEFAWLSLFMKGRLRDKIVDLSESDEMLSRLVSPADDMHKSVLTQTVLDEVFGFGPLGPVLRDPTVGDVMVNGPDSVFVERDGRFEKSSVFFKDENHMTVTINKIFKPLGADVTQHNVASVYLPNGSWAVAALPPVNEAVKAMHAPMLIIRCARSVLSK